MSRWIEKYATAILAVSEGAMKAWNPNWQRDSRCRVIYNGIRTRPDAAADAKWSVRSELGIPHDATVIIHVGTIARWKNHVRRIRIFAQLKRDLPGAYLLVVGRDGGTRAQVEAEAEAACVSAAVVFTGERHDVLRLLRAADAMIFPSLREGLPGVLLEAAAVGTPAIASAVPGAVEIAAVCPSVTCLPLTAPDAEWAASTRSALSLPRRTAGLAATRFDIASTAAELRGVYDSCAS